MKSYILLILYIAGAVMACIYAASNYHMCDICQSYVRHINSKRNRNRKGGDKEARKKESNIKK